MGGSRAGSTHEQLRARATRSPLPFVSALDRARALARSAGVAVGGHAAGSGQAAVRSELRPLPDVYADPLTVRRGASTSLLLPSSTVSRDQSASSLSCLFLLLALNRRRASALKRLASRSAVVARPTRLSPFAA